MGCWSHPSSSQRVLWELSAGQYLSTQSREILVWTEMPSTWKPPSCLSLEGNGLQQENKSFVKSNVQVFQPGLQLTADFHTLLLILLYGSSFLCSQRGTGCQAREGHQNALYAKLPSTQRKQREDGKNFSPDKESYTLLATMGSKQHLGRKVIFQADRTASKRSA